MQKINIYGSVYGTGESFKESWPATAGIKLCGGFIKRSLASYAAEYSFLEELVIFSGSWLSEKKKKTLTIKCFVN